MQWTVCPPAPLAWFSLRELLLGLVHTPALPLLLPLALSAIYSPPATAILSGWLQSQLPAAPSSGSAAVVLLLGRGDAITAAATSSVAAQLQRDPSLLPMCRVTPAPPPSVSCSSVSPPAASPPGCANTTPASPCC